VRFVLRSSSVEIVLEDSREATKKTSEVYEKTSEVKMTALGNHKGFPLRFVYRIPHPAHCANDVCAFCGCFHLLPDMVDVITHSVTRFP